MNRRKFIGGVVAATASAQLLRGARATGAEFFGRFPSCTEFDAKVPIARIATGRIIHRFFDTSPISPSGRYVGLFRLPNETRTPQPGETGEVVVVDLQTGKERVVAES